MVYRIFKIRILNKVLEYLKIFSILLFTLERSDTNSLLKFNNRLLYLLKSFSL
jgi:hypothetical protein